MKKRALTLIEIMIVILLISLIGGAIGYNMKGALNRGKSFKTEQAKRQLEDFLEICLAEGRDPQEFLKDNAGFLSKYSFAKDPKALLVDGEGRPFDITYDAKENSFKVEVKK